MKNDILKSHQLRRTESPPHSSSLLPPLNSPPTPTNDLQHFPSISLHQNLPNGKDLKLISIMV